MRHFGQTFERFIEINIVDQPAIRSLFADPAINIAKVIESLEAFFGVAIEDEKTLVFIDEIQASPEAIAMLRFFYERRPKLHLVASGSLLEFTLEEISSFGVGRIEYLYLYPLSFAEFLRAQQESLLLGQIQKATFEQPLPDLLHLRCLALLKTYLMIGGLPELVAHYIQTKSLGDVGRFYSTLLTAYDDDFSKYSKRLRIEYLRETFRSTAVQGGKKFIFSHAYRDANSKVVHKALDLITKAGLVHKVYHSSGNGIPLGAEVDIGKFKTIPLDLGIYNRLVGGTTSEISLLDPLDILTKGVLAELFCGLELLSNAEPYEKASLYYWHRESKSSNAEVDYLLSIAGKIIPVEVKSSGKGAMHSMYRFLQEKKNRLGVRVSTENFGRIDNILIIPLYAVSEIERIVTMEMSAPSISSDDTHQSKV